jgi:anti-sigma B factor antagonist
VRHETSGNLPSTIDASMSTQQIVVDSVESGVSVVAVHGEHDVYTAPTLREQLSSLLEDGTPVVVDLTPATFVDSSILGVLLGGLRRAREHDSGFALVIGDDSEPTVRRIFEVTGLFPVFPVFSSRDEAVHAARANRSG